ncbi:MAG: MFS transporter [Zavarzinella sp.]
MISPAPGTTPNSFRPWMICGLLLLATVLNYMDRNALSQNGVRIKTYYGIDNAAYGHIEGGYNWGFAAGAIIIGMLVDRGNVRWIYAIIVVAWSIAGILTSYAPTLTYIILCRVMLGFFESGNWSCGVVTTKRILPPAKRSMGNSLLHSGTAVGAILTPLVILLTLEAVVSLGYPSNSPLVWKMPFRVVGILGILWAILWLAIVRDRDVRADSNLINEKKSSYWSIFSNKKFWVCVVVVVSINITWRSYGFWLPVFLQQEKGYSERTMNLLSSTYYLFADMGSLTVGWLTMRLIGRGFSFKSARTIVMVGCVGLTLLTLIAAILPKSAILIVVVLAVGFGAMGLFPTYFTLSQEVSAHHQGKVTGTLSAINAAALAVIVPLQGKLAVETKSFFFSLGMVGIAPIFAVLAFLVFWKDSETGKTFPTKH